MYSMALTRNSVRRTRIKNYWSMPRSSKLMVWKGFWLKKTKHNVSRTFDAASSSSCWITISRPGMFCSQRSKSTKLQRSWSCLKKGVYEDLFDISPFFTWGSFLERRMRKEYSCVSTLPSHLRLMTKFVQKWKVEWGFARLPFTRRV